MNRKTEENPYSSNLLIISEKAGLVMKTPAVIPIRVVKAKPFRSPAPAHSKGSIETAAVK